MTGCVVCWLLATLILGVMLQYSTAGRSAGQPTVWPEWVPGQTKRPSWAREQEAAASLRAARMSNPYYWDTKAVWGKLTASSDWSAALSRAASTSSPIPALPESDEATHGPSISRQQQDEDSTTTSTLMLSISDNPNKLCGDDEGALADLVAHASPPEFPNVPSAYWGKPEVPVAFVLYAHNDETVHGVERLLHWLYAKEHTFVFHVDGKETADALHCYLYAKYGGLENVGFAPRSKIEWGSWNIVQAEINAIAVARRMSSQWRFTISLCGSTLLIKPARYLDYYLRTRLVVRRFADANANQTGVAATAPPLEPGAADDAEVEYISSIPVQPMAALDERNPERAEHAKRMLPHLNAQCQPPSEPLTTPPLGTAEHDPYCNTPGHKPWWKGAQWKIMARDFVEYALDSEEGQGWLEFFGRSFKPRGCTDEAWAQTILMNSAFRSRAVAAHNVFTYWPDAAAGEACSHADRRPGIWAGMSPCYISLWEYDRIRGTPLIFARKFYFNDPVVERVRSELVYANPGGARAVTILRGVGTRGRAAVKLAQENAQQQYEEWAAEADALGFSDEAPSADAA